MAHNQRNQLFIKRFPPKKVTNNQISSKWTPIFTDYQSFESVQSKSLLTLISKSKDPVIIFTGLVRDLLKTLITITCIMCCALQIRSLAGEYFKYEVIESSSQDESKEIHPPDFSFCFNALGLINVTQLFIARPDVADTAKLFLKQCRNRGNCLFNDERSLILDLSIGPAIVYSRLRTNEIYSLLPKLSTLLSMCHYLSPNVTIVSCDESFFQPYLYSQKICFEFLWYSRKSPNQTLPVFHASSLIIPGFQNSELLNVHFNLTKFQDSGPTLLDMMAHPQLDVPWNPETGTKELKVHVDQQMIHELAYLKITRLSLPAPYETNCTDYSKLPFRSRRECIANCSLEQFIKISDYYPWYYPIRSFDNHFLAFSHSNRETYQSLIQQLSEKCSTICGLLECYEVSYELFGLTSSRQFTPGVKGVQVIIFPSTQANSLTRTSPVQTYEYFFASIGGVIGVWFGFSAYYTIKLISKLIITIYNKIKTKWNQRQNRIVNFRPTIRRFSQRAILKITKN